MLPCTMLGSSATLADLRATRPLEILTDWATAALDFRARFYFACTSESLFVGADVATRPIFPPSDTKDFAPGLWEYDVIELFIKDDSGLAYQEFNLSADGKWWTGLFHSYRKPNDDFAPPQGVKRDHQTTADGFYAAIQIPRARLGVKFSCSRDSRANIAAIIGGPPRRFLSYHRAAPEQPDFHHLSCFQAVAPENPGNV